jgi:hypothetical protein
LAYLKEGILIPKASSDPEPDGNTQSTGRDKIAPLVAIDDAARLGRHAAPL